MSWLCNAEVAMFINVKMYTTFTLTIKVIYNMQTAKKPRDPACIAKWSKDYTGFQRAHNEF